MRRLFVILDDPRYGTERSSNGLRLAGASAKRDGTDLAVFLIGDAAGSAAGNLQVHGTVAVVGERLTPGGGTVTGGSRTHEATGTRVPGVTGC